MHKRSGLIPLIIIVLASLALFCATAALIHTYKRPYNLLQSISDETEVLHHYREYAETHDDQRTAYILLDIEKSQPPGTITEIYAPLVQLTALLKQVSGLNAVRSLSDAEYPAYDPATRRLFAQPFFSQDGALFPEGLEVLRSSHLFKGTFLGKSERSTLITVTFQRDLPASEKETAVRNLLNAAQTIEQHFAGAKVHAVGPDIVRYHLTQEIGRGQLIIAPLVLLLISLVMFTLFRSWAVVVLTLYVMATCYAATAALVIALEHSFSHYSNFALLFVFVVSCSELIHFFNALQQADAPTWQQRIRLARKRVLVPCCLTSLCNLLGFVSLVFCSLEPVSHFGITCSFGIVFSIPMIFWVLPLLLRFTPIPHKPAAARQFSPRFVATIRRFSPGIILLFGLIAILGCWGSTNVSFREDLYDKFMANHRFAQATAALDREFGFANTFDLTIRIGEEHARTTAGEEVLSSLTRQLEKLPNIGSVRSPIALQSDIRTRLVPKKTDPHTYSFASDQELASILNPLQNALANRDYAPPDNERTVTLALQSVDADLVAKTAHQVEVLAQRMLEPIGLRAELNGFPLIHGTLVKQIFDGFTDSFLFECITIFIVFWRLNRSFRWALLGMLPNLFPLVAIGGLIGIARIEADYNLVIVCSIILGVAVDDTIHFLHTLRHKLSDGVPFADAIAETLITTGRALIAATLIFCLTVSAFLLSELTLFFQIAYVLIVALLIALSADLLLLPAILFLLGRSGREARSD